MYIICYLFRGAVGSKTEAFREEYRNLGELRSLFSHAVPFVALTATAMPRVEHVICSNLYMKNPLKLTESPNRPNIFYAVQHISSDIEKHFEWLVDEVRSGSCQRTIIFCFQKEHARRLQAMFFDAFPEYSGRENTSLPFEYYHAGTRDYVKEQVSESFADPHGVVKVLLATTAFGVGIDCKNTKRIIHVGPPSDIDDYVQESGRAGRDGTQSQAILLLYPGHASGRDIMPYMTEYVKNTERCRRQIIVEAFGMEYERTGEVCCDVCNPSSVLMNFQVPDAAEEEPNFKFAKDVESLLVETLQDNTRNTNIGFSGNSITSGCPRSLPKELLKKNDHISSAADVYRHTSVTDINTAEKVFVSFERFRTLAMFPNQVLERGTDELSDELKSISSTMSSSNRTSDEYEECFFRSESSDSAVEEEGDI